jgi:peptide/nickel transport system substrate-binding protein
MKQRVWWWIVPTALGLAACRETPRCPSDWCGTAVLFAGEPAVLLPPVAQTDADLFVTSLIFSRLADVGPALNTVGDSGFVPQLAESWSWDNTTTLRFRLNPKAHWHDGRPVTAKDVAFTFDVYRDPVVNTKERSLLEHIASVTAVDSQSVVFRFTRAYPEAFFDATYQMWILPAHILDTVPPARLSSHPFGRSPVGSGPYRFVQWTTGQAVDLAADSSYFLGRPGLRRMIWRIVPDMTVAVTQLSAGELDAGSAILSPELYQRLGSAPQLTLTPYPANSYAYVGFNLRDPLHLDRPNPLFGDRTLRRAISMAVDRRTLVQTILGDLGELPSGPFPPWLWIASDSVRPLPFDTAGARRTLDSLGWRLGADGVRARNGRKLTFDLLVPTTSALRRRAAVIVQDQLKRVGIAMGITELDLNAFIERTQSRRFDAAFLAFGSDPSPRTIAQVWSSKAIGASNSLSYSNPTFDRLTDQAIAEWNRTRAGALWRQAMQTINADAPAIWIYVPRPVLVAHQRLGDTPIRPDLWTAFLWTWRVNPDSLIPRDLVAVP